MPGTEQLWQLRLKEHNITYEDLNVYDGFFTGKFTFTYNGEPATAVIERFSHYGHKYITTGPDGAREYFYKLYAAICAEVFE